MIVQWGKKGSIREVTWKSSMRWIEGNLAEGMMSGERKGVSENWNALTINKKKKKKKTIVKQEIKFNSLFFFSISSISTRTTRNVWKVKLTIQYNHLIW